MARSSIRNVLANLESYGFHTEELLIANIEHGLCKEASCGCSMPLVEASLKGVIELCKDIQSGLCLKCVKEGRTTSGNCGNSRPEDCGKYESNEAHLRLMYG